jgi:hypothetical protein
MRGRVVALFGVLNLGVSPLGGLLIGTLAEVMGTRGVVALGGIAAVVVAGLGGLLLWRSSGRRAAAVATADSA